MIADDEGVRDLVATQVEADQQVAKLAVAPNVLDLHAAQHAQVVRVSLVVVSAARAGRALSPQLLARVADEERG